MRLTTCAAAFVVTSLSWMCASQVQRSVEYVQGGTVALQEAKKHQKNTRKWMCCGIITLLFIAAIIVIFVVKPWTLVNGTGGQKPPSPPPSQ